MALISTSKKHLELLRLATSPDFPKKVYAGQTFNGREIAFELYEDLADARLIDAKPEKDGQKILMWVHYGLSVKGRAALQQQEDWASLSGWLRANRTWLLQQIIAALISIAVSIVTTLIVLRLKGAGGP